MKNQRDLWEKTWKRETKLRHNPFAELVLKYKQPQHTILLDLGCGIGQDTIFFLQNGFKVTATDWATSGLKKLKRKIKNTPFLQNLKTSVQDVRELSFKANSFDIIYSHLSLHYFNTQTTQKIMQNLHKILKSSGLLFIKVKSTKDPLFGKGHKIDTHTFSYYGHVRHFFNKKELASLLKSFNIISLQETEGIYSGYRSSFIEVVARK